MTDQAKEPVIYVRTRRRAQRAGLTLRPWDAVPRRRRVWLWWVTL